MNLVKLYKNLYKPQTPLTGKDYNQAVLTAIFIVVVGLVLGTYLLMEAGKQDPTTDLLFPFVAQFIFVPYIGIAPLIKCSYLRLKTLGQSPALAFALLIPLVNLYVIWTISQKKD